MKTIQSIILCANLFFLTFSFAQTHTLHITNTETQKERLIKEYKRIRAKTVTGEKFQGRFTIIDENTIALEGITLTLSEIEKIKRHPLFNTIFIKSNLVHIGGVSLFLGILGTGLSSASNDQGTINYGFVIGGAVILAGGIYGAIKSPNLNKGYHINKKWKFSIRTEIKDEGQLTNIVNQL